jgi:hypothetical protein
MKAKSKSVPAGKPRTAIEQKADKARAQWTEAMHAGIVKTFPAHGDLQALPLLPLDTFKKVDELQKLLTDDEARLAHDVSAYEGLRRDGINKLSDHTLATRGARVGLTERLQQARDYVIRGQREVASKKARLTQLQGGLLAPAFKALPAPPKVIEKPTVENAKDVTWLPVFRDVLEAAVMVAPKEEKRAYLMGVFLQADKQSVRAVASNGHCLFLHSTPTGAEEKQKLPAWLEAGVTLPRDGLALALSTIGKLKDQLDETPSAVMIGYAKGHAHVTLKDSEEQVVFRMRVAQGQYPDTRKLIEEAGAVLESGERAPMAGTSVQGEYMKQAAAIGAKFDAKGLTTFAGTDPKAPVVITFLGLPNALYIVSPLGVGAAEQLPTATMALMGRGLAGTLAALKATQTRQKKQMAECGSESTKKQMAAVIAERDERIAAVLQAMNGKALEAPKPAKPAAQTSTDKITAKVIESVTPKNAEANGAAVVAAIHKEVPAAGATVN